MLVAALSAEFARMDNTPLVVALCDAETVGNSLETEQRMAHEIQAAGGEFISLGLSASRNPVVGARRLASALSNFAPQVIHAHTVRALPMLTLATTRAPVLLTHHNTRLPFPSWMLRVCDWMTDGYVAIGADVETILRRNARKSITRIPNAASRSFEAGEPRQLASGSKTILSVGAVSAQKNYGLLIDVAKALKSLNNLDPLPRFRIAGGGAELQTLRQKVAEDGLRDIVEFLGERSDVPELMQESDLYLNVSLYEGMPLTLLEAMASGLPIVATDVPGNRELVEDGANGLKAPLGDAKAIAESLSRVLSDDSLYRQLSCGSVHKSADFSIERCAERHLELYTSLTRHPPK